MELVWEDRELYKKGKNLLLHFLAKKFNFKSIEDVEIVLSSSHMSTNKKLKSLKENFIGKAKSLTSPKKTLLPSPWIINADKEYTGWSVFDANFLPLLTNYGFNIPELKGVFTFKFSTMLDITSSLLFNIKGQFADDEFLYVNIGDVGGDLFSGVSQLLTLDSNKAINYTSKDIAASNAAIDAASMVTIFMSACHFVDIDDMFKKIYELCADGAYLIIKEYNLPSSARDKASFYETAYNLYRILYNEISIEEFMKKKIVAHYKTRYEWVDYISSFGFTPVAINILNENVPYYDGMIMVFIKSLL